MPGRGFLNRRRPRRSNGGVRKLFLLSPARMSGARARLLLNPQASFALAQDFQEGRLTLAEAFAFASGLYFRGKITYARRFLQEPDDAVRVITSNAGLLKPDTRVTRYSLESFGEIDIEAEDPRYLRPLRRDARLLARRLAPDGIAVLLGSIATPKYRDVLLEVFGERLQFPCDFIGRGDMSRGALLLRHARSGEELPYGRVLGAVYRGRRARRVTET